MDVSVDLAFKVQFKNIGDYAQRAIPVKLTVNVFNKHGLHQDAEGRDHREP